MITDEHARAASDLLCDHWQKGTVLAGLPDDLRPADRADGYAIQARLEARTQAPLFGWKIAATSAAGQAHINVDGPMAGRLLAERVVAPGTTVSLENNRMRVAEVEFAFRMGRSLPPRPVPYSADEVLAAVEALHPAIEVPDSRFGDFTAVGAPQLIADNACAHLFLLGEATEADWRGMDLAAHSVLGHLTGRSGSKRTLEGSGANVLDDPRLALAWAANELSRLGLALEAGQVVSTGTTTVPIPVEPGDAVEGDLGPLGRISLRFG